jgi:AraC-like DNA-binding protein
VIAAIVDFMHAHHDQDLSLDDMGRRFALTPFQLIRAFKKAVGLTPHAYLTQLRLNQACRLLRRATPIAEAAAAVGFYDQSASPATSSAPTHHPAAIRARGGARAPRLIGSRCRPDPHPTLSRKRERVPDERTFRTLSRLRERAG